MKRLTPFHACPIIGKNGLLYYLLVHIKLLEEWRTINIVIRSVMSRSFAQAYHIYTNYWNLQNSLLNEEILMITHNTQIHDKIRKFP